MVGLIEDIRNEFKIKLTDNLENELYPKKWTDRKKHLSF